MTDAIALSERGDPSGPSLYSPNLVVGVLSEVACPSAPEVAAALAPRPYAS
jgi:hypothetical protein